jgi:hypothetical protein
MYKDVMPDQNDAMGEEGCVEALRNSLEFASVKIQEPKVSEIAPIVTLVYMYTVNAGLCFAWHLLIDL